MTDDATKTDREKLLADIKRVSPGGQIPAKELYAPDPAAKSMQGPMEVVHATFANCRIKHGSRNG